jgi:UPF0176 protein
MITSDQECLKTQPDGFLHIAGYRFIKLNELNELRQDLLNHCGRLNLKGTILLSNEGVNINLVGTDNEITTIQDLFNQHDQLRLINFRLTRSSFIPYKQLKVKIKNEIITINQPQIDYTNTRAPSISPSEFKKWLDEKRDITILDTRNDYEVKMGTFENAINPNIQHFTQLIPAVAHLDKTKPMVVFCTGGIRCEKAALCLKEQGFDNIYQLDGGILNYFATEGSAHYKGECFIFDQRITVNADVVIK